MRNLVFMLRYDGSAYHGFAVQKNAATVGGTFQKALRGLTGLKEDMKGCSRTDAGVHADMFCLSLKTQSAIPCDAFVRALNARLPQDIAVFDCFEMPTDFHARYSCLGKEYIYKIDNSAHRNPFSCRYALHHPYYVDVDMLNSAARGLVGRHDFTSFCGTNGTQTDMVRTLYACDVTREGCMIYITVRGDGFLYNMVRIIAGTLLDTARGRLAPDALGDIVAARDRTRAGVTLPPWGLYLHRVFYREFGETLPELDNRQNTRP